MSNSIFDTIIYYFDGLNTLLKLFITSNHCINLKHTVDLFLVLFCFKQAIGNKNARTLQCEKLSYIKTIPFSLTLKLVSNSLCYFRIVYF